MSVAFTTLIHHHFIENIETFIIPILKIQIHTYDKKNNFIRKWFK